MLNEAELGAFVDQHMGTSVFRLETRDRYTVDSDVGNVERYLSNEPEPAMDVKGPWLRRLRQERAEGKRRTRVHVLRSPLSDYLRYECEWGYVHTSQAGEGILILDLANQPGPPELVDEDFILLNDEHVVVVHYDDEDRFVGAQPQPASVLAGYQRCRDAAIAEALPFEVYWAGRPQDWRVNWACGRG